MTLREEILKNSGIIVEADALADFSIRKSSFEKELKQLENKYNLSLDFNFDEIRAIDHETRYPIFFSDTENKVPKKMKPEKYKEAIGRVNGFKDELKKLENKYNLKFDFGKVKTEDEDTGFIVYDKNNNKLKAYINV